MFRRTEDIVYFIFFLAKIFQCYKLPILESDSRQVSSEVLTMNPVFAVQDENFTFFSKLFQVSDFKFAGTFVERLFVGSRGVYSNFSNSIPNHFSSGGDSIFIHFTTYIALLGGRTAVFIISRPLNTCYPKFHTHKYSSFVCTELYQLKCRTFLKYFCLLHHSFPLP